MGRKMFVWLSLSLFLLLMGGNAAAQAPLNELAAYHLQFRDVSASQSYQVAVLSDTHIEPEGWPPPDVGPSPFDGSHLEAMLAQFAAWEGTSNEIAFVIVTGDFVHTYCEATLYDYYDNVAYFMSSTGIPVFQAVGNHELASRVIDQEPPEEDIVVCDWISPAVTFENYFDLFGDPDYAIDFFLDRFVITNDTSFVVSDSNPLDQCSLDALFHGACEIEDLAISVSKWGTEELDYAYSILDDQLDSVETHLMADKRFELAFVHVPIKAGYDNGGRIDMDAYTEYRNVLKQYNVSAVFNGHVHAWDRYDDWFTRTRHIWHVRTNDTMDAASPLWTKIVMTPHIGAPGPKVLATFCTNAACTTNSGGTWVIHAH